MNPMTAANILQSISVILAAFTVIVGVTAWRREYVGKRRIELAEEVLALFYEARDVIRYIRNPFSFGGEGGTRSAAPNESPEEKQINDMAYVVFERCSKHQELFNKIYSMRYRYMAQFGKDSAKPFDDLRKIVNDIFVSARMLSHYWLQQGRRQWKDEAEFKEHLDEMRKQEAIFWEKSLDKDPIIPRVEAVISDIEARSREIIEGGALMSSQNSRLSRAWSRLESKLFLVLLPILVVLIMVGGIAYVVRYIQSLVDRKPVTSPLDLALIAATLGGLILVGAFYKEKDGPETSLSLGHNLKRIAKFFLGAAVSFTITFLLLEALSTMKSPTLGWLEWLFVYATALAIAVAVLTLSVALAFLVGVIRRL